jgi:hypothetical protein
MITHVQLAIVIAVAIILKLAGLSFDWTVSVVFALVLLFEFFLWRFFIFKAWLVKRPLLWGTWRAELRTDWVDPETNQTKPPIHGFMTIWQTYTRLRLQLYTEESSSKMLGVELRCEEDGSFTIVGVYRNEPRYSVRTDSPTRPGSAIHLGALELQVRGDPAHTIEGHYWTDRKTGGEIILASRYPKRLDGYNVALKLLGPNP